MSQYLQLGEKILNEGTWVTNERTGVRCLTLIGASQEYDVGAGVFPIPSARFTPFYGPIGELLGYWRGYTSAAQFRGVETKTWDMNAKNWNKGTDDYMGVVYGGVAKDWPVMNMDEPGDIRYDANSKLDLFHKVYNNLSKGIDDRGETITFWNPGMFECGCLRPCLRTHTFSLLNDDLYLTSEQRSYDWALGGAYNSQQCYHMLDWMAAITGKNPKIAKHQIINAHIYENQIPFAEELVRRGEHPDSQPRIIRPNNLSLSALEQYAKPRDWKLEGYVPFEKMSIPFTV